MVKPSTARSPGAGAGPPRRGAQGCQNRHKGRTADQTDPRSTSAARARAKASRITGIGPPKDTDSPHPRLQGLRSRKRPPGIAEGSRASYVKGINIWRNR